MTTPDARWLQQVPLFSLLDEHERSSLLARADVQHHAAEEVIFSAGEPGGVMYVIERGRIEIYVRDTAHERLTVAEMGAGEIFGEVSVLDNQPRSASAKALEATTLLAITHTSTLAQNRATVRNPNREIAREETRTFGHRIADLLTAVAGDMRFIYFSLAFVLVWYVVNLGLIAGIKPFDPYPFGLLTMLLTVETIFLTLILLISQNRAAARDRIRNDVEYQVNLQAEAGIRELHTRMEDVEAMLLKLLDRSAAPERHSL